MPKRAITSAPCAHCPFRKDVPIYLRADRRIEIAQSLADGNDFPCHKTVEHDDDGGIANFGSTTTCAGAAKALMAIGGTTQMMRIAERLGMADLDRTEESGAECWDLNEWVRLAEGATADNPERDPECEGEPCYTSGSWCIAPAGYLTASGAAFSIPEAADGECAECGEPLCSECADENGRCEMCAEWYEENEDD